MVSIKKQIQQNIQQACFQIAAISIHFSEFLSSKGLNDHLLAIICAMAFSEKLIPDQFGNEKYERTKLLVSDLLKIRRTSCQRNMDSSCSSSTECSSKDEERDRE